MRRSLKKMMAVGLTAAMTVGSISFQGLSVNAAGLPTTDGHNKYVNSEVFNVISDDSFGTKELENPLFDKTTGSSDISNLQVPTLAYDDTSIALVWDKPEKYDNVADYNVYVNGTLDGTARKNYEENECFGLHRPRFVGHSCQWTCTIVERPVQQGQH